jgi:hypothetical protein
MVKWNVVFLFAGCIGMAERQASFPVSFRYAENGFY